MLVLVRRLGESIQIGDNITVTITDINRGHVGIGISAPREIIILREELIGKPAMPEKDQT